MLTLFQTLQLISFALLMSLGQVLFKKTALTISHINEQKQVLGLFEGVIAALMTPWLYFALIVYGTATIFWLYLLQRIPLSVAYPFGAIAMVLVPIFSVYLFGDKLNINYWFGMTFIIIGISIIAR